MSGRFAVTTQAQTLRALANVLLFPDLESLARTLADDLASHIFTVVTGRDKQEMMGHVSRRADFPMVRVRPTAWYPDTEAVAFSECHKFQ